MDTQQNFLHQIQPYETEHRLLVRKLAPECTVLLKSAGDFPLESPCPVALYGNGARHTVMGGTGSGEVNTRTFVNVEEGLKEAGFTIATSDWLDGYDAVLDRAHEDFLRGIRESAKKKHTLALLEGMGKVMPHPEYDLPVTNAGCDTAVYVLSRISGEGADRQSDPGDILPGRSELRDILAINSLYRRFLLVLNTGGPVDLSPLEAVGNILVLSQLGIDTGNVLADLLLGKAYPSGKLTTTWTAWEDYCDIGDFGNADDTCYTEDIYVGYRYFDSVGKKPLFPFGFGLGYTTFSFLPGEAGIALPDEDTGLTGFTGLTGPSAFGNSDLVTVSAAVKNTGSFAGRETLQLYVSPPARTLNMPYQTLAAFAKTPELTPGESTELKLSFHLSDLSSYDGKTACWFLDRGDYLLRLGTSSRDTVICAVIRIGGNEDAVDGGRIILRKCKNVLGDAGFIPWRPEKEKALQPGSLTVPGGIPVICVDPAVFCAAYTENICTETAAGPDRKGSGEPAGNAPEEIDEIPADAAGDRHLTDLIESLPDKELAYLNIGAFSDAPSALSLIGSAGKKVAGAAGESTGKLADRGIPSLVMSDGPAGLRLSPLFFTDRKGVHSMEDSLPQSMLELLSPFQKALIGLFKKKPGKDAVLHEQYATAIPIGTAIAQSWDPALAEACGDIVGDEMERFGVHLWLAPALNIHRDIRCGRNFEYYSEDPLVSGIFAAAVTRGVQKHPGCGVTIKHFAANNQETNRYNNNSRVTERAMREIYLRGFDLCIRYSSPAALMTSYNLLNGTHTSEHRGLIEDILRHEFGFKGIVMTDWVTARGILSKGAKYAPPRASRIAAAGGDLAMPGEKEDYKDILNALKDGSLDRKALLTNALRVAALAKKMNAEHVRYRKTGKN
ncbi:MAG: glycoside hydrolase family 3 C-terminal domain-containing protein [Lachnospiraceae bacterium]|nr:glycoside hydrolase family 3 C-terminal domain-containing protein [Lachnospiraceae bacterium]